MCFGFFLVWTALWKEVGDVSPLVLYASSEVLGVETLTRLDSTSYKRLIFFFFIYFDIHIYCLHRYLMYQVDLLIIIISSVCGSVLYENLKGSRSFQLTICWRDYISIYFQKCVLTNLKKLFSHFNENQPLSLAWSFTLVSCYRIAVVTIWFLVLL